MCSNTKQILIQHTKCCASTVSARIHAFHHRLLDSCTDTASFLIAQCQSFHQHCSAIITMRHVPERHGICWTRTPFGNKRHRGFHPNKLPRFRAAQWSIPLSHPASRTIHEPLEILLSSLDIPEMAVMHRPFPRSHDEVTKRCVFLAKVSYIAGILFSEVDPGFPSSQCEI